MEFAPTDSSISPTIWNMLSLEDRGEYHRLKNQFNQMQRGAYKDRKPNNFVNDIIALIGYINRSESKKQERSLMVGLAFSGPYICVNTRQLKSVVGRCKSSINGSFQQLNYTALKTKQKAKECIQSLFPSYTGDTGTLRQWTVRCVTDECQFCFYSPSRVYTPKNDEQNCTFVTSQSPSPPLPTPPVEMKQTRHRKFDLSFLDDDDEDDSVPKIPELTPSFSIDYLNELDNKWDDDIMPIDSMFEPPKTMTRSQSAFLESDKWWNFCS